MPAVVNVTRSACFYAEYCYDSIVRLVLYQQFVVMG